MNRSHPSTHLCYNSTWCDFTDICHLLPSNIPRWRHQRETLSALLALCEGNPSVTDGFPSQRPVTWSFDVFFICAWTNCAANNRDAGDLRCHRAHYDVTTIHRACFVRRKLISMHLCKVSYLRVCFHSFAFFIVLCHSFWKKMNTRVSNIKPNAFHEMICIYFFLNSKRKLFLLCDLTN